MACVMRLAGCVISILYQYAEQRRGRQTSNVLFLYWTLNACCSTATYYRVLRNTFSSRSESLPSAFTYTVQMIAYPIMWGLVVLYSFTEHYGKKKPGICPMDVASPISYLSFEWYTSLILSGYRKTLSVDDLFPVSEEVKTVNNYKRWLRVNKNAADGRHLKWSLFRTIWGNVMTTLVGQIMFAFFRTAPPVLLTFIIRFVINKKEEYWKGYFYAAIIFLTGKAGMTLLRHCDFHYVVMGLQLKGILVHAVYTKTLRIASACLTKYTAGEIINLMTVDADKIYQTSLFVTAGMGALFMTLMSAVWLWFFIGPSSLTIIVVTLVIFSNNRNAHPFGRQAAAEAHDIEGQSAHVHQRSAQQHPHPQVLHLGNSLHEPHSGHPQSGNVDDQVLRHLGGHHEVLLVYAAVFPVSSHLRRLL
ncbi:hypothetical protein HPB51_017228 [Rhipicephalus microplus]|uniref:ABC transmembrane type-1 domain-containing protein n=1 Tax=Rhipicephalus microplus TaxID=6941 RepID=A0A9J6EBI6_RHIMP|nr:hypothetical protein HPB51_017228 [Rhipicephalus microplus]